MRISVYITSYNQKEYLIEAIESVLSQTLKPYQIIIVDDCSTDGSQEVIRGYLSRFPKLIMPIFHQKNTGVTKVRIDALKAVNGDYVTYVDGDDRFLSTKLEKETKALKENPDAKIAFSNNFYMKEDGTHIGIWADGEKPSEGYIFKETFARDFPKRNLFRMELIEYEALREIGFHDTGLHIYEDYDMRIRLTKKLFTVYCDEPLSEIRMHDEGLSKSKVDRHLEALEYIYKKNKHLLYDLSKKERTYVQKKIGRWIAQIARKASRESLKEKKTIQAAKFLMIALRYDNLIFG